MHTRGTFDPETEAEARNRYEALGPVVQTVVRETARAMDFDREEYEARVTPEVIETARNALFASMLLVRVGSADEFEDWIADVDEDDVTVVGSEHVDSVVWYDAPFDGTIAATFQYEEEAAVDTLRRQAFGRLFKPLFS